MRQVAERDGRPEERGGRAVRPRRVTRADSRYSAAARSRQVRGDRSASSAPPVAKPAICVRPQSMLETERPRT